MNNKLIVKGLGCDYKEPLACIIFDSFYVQIEKNDNWQLQFTCYNDGSIAFDMLTAEASVFWENQEYIIKQLIPDYSGGITTYQVVATHIAYELYRVYQRNTETGTYTPEEVLSFYLANNTLGFTYEVIGDFTGVAFADLGASNAKDMLAKITDAWPDAIFYPDNKNIRIYQHDSIAKDKGNRIDYLHDTNEVKLTYDSTNGIVNKLRVISPEKSNDDDTTTYYFDPFYVKDDASIDMYGEHDGGDITDDSLITTALATAYAKNQLIPDPSLSIEVKQDGNVEPVMFEIRRVEIRPAGYVTTVEVVSIQQYPLSLTEQTDVVLNSKTKTILDYQEAQQNKLKQDLKTEINKIEKTAVNNYSSLQDYTNLVTSNGIITRINENNDTAIDYFASLRTATIEGVVINISTGQTTSAVAADQYTNSVASGLIFAGVSHTFQGSGTEEAQVFYNKLQDMNIPNTTPVVLIVTDSSLSDDKSTLDLEIQDFFSFLANNHYKTTCIYSYDTWFDSKFTSSLASGEWKLNITVSTKPSGNPSAWEFSSNYKSLSVNASYAYNSFFV